MTSEFRRVAVTGGSGYVGGRLLKRLEADDRVDHVLALDVIPPEETYSTKVCFERRDVTEPLADALTEHRIEAVAHLAFVMGADRGGEAAEYVNIDGATNVLDACTKAGVSHFLYFSSTTVYGAHPDNPDALTEESALRPVRGFRYGEHKAAVESTIRWSGNERTDMSAVVLRSCPVMGPNTDNFISRAFSKPFLVGVLGYDPPMQFVHEDDMADVLVECLLRPVSGVYNMAGEGTIRWSQMARAFGRRLVHLPAALLYPLTGLSWGLRVQRDSPSPGLDFIRYPWTVGTGKIKRELGVKFHYSSREAWEAFALREILEGPQEAKGAS